MMVACIQSEGSFIGGVLESALSGILVSLIWAGLIWLYLLLSTKKRKKKIGDALDKSMHVVKINDDWGVSMQNETPFPFTVTGIEFKADSTSGNLLPWNVSFCQDGTILTAEETDVFMRPHGFGRWRVKHPEGVTDMWVSCEFMLTPAGGVVELYHRIEGSVYDDLKKLLEKG